MVQDVANAWGENQIHVALNAAKCQDAANIHPIACQHVLNPQCQDNENINPRAFHHVKNSFYIKMKEVILVEIATAF